MTKCFDDLQSSIDHLSTKMEEIEKELDELQEYKDAAEAEYDKQIKAYDDANDKLEDKLCNNKTLLEEIIQKAEDWDYGLKGWRTLETKQDLINAIKKEILEA